MSASLRITNVETRMPPAMPRPHAGQTNGDSNSALDTRALVERYLRLREVCGVAQNSAIRLLKRADILGCGRELGLLHDGLLVFEDEHEMAPLFDFAIYEHKSGGLTAVQRYWRTNRPKAGSIEAEVRDAMLDDTCAMLVVERVRPGVGIDARDIMLDHEHFIVDLNFSRSAAPGLFLATRLLHFDEFSMTTGAALPFAEEMIPDIEAEIQDSLEAVTSKSVRDLDAIASAIHAGVLRACLSSECEIGIRHEDAAAALGRPAERPGASVRQAETAVEREPRRPRFSDMPAMRNGPCPCGSGLKHTKCCGAACRK